MTTIYFIRHAEADNYVRDGRIRPLTKKGLADRKLVTEFLQDKNIDVILSSPFKRAVDTLADFAEKNGFEIKLIEDFREQKSISAFDKKNELDPIIRKQQINEFLERQWADFSYIPSDSEYGETLLEVQMRNIAALTEVLTQYKDKNIVIGTHGTALSTIINYYDNTYGYNDFMEMVHILPWVVKMYFDGNDCAGMEKIDLFNLNIKSSNDWWKVSTSDFGSLKSYRFVVIFARYQDKWLYCRATERDTFETAGGHIEQGETPLEAAKRELYEETGAIKFDITPAFDYSVHKPNEYSNGQVFLAHIHELGEMPDYTNDKMAEVKLFDTIPDKMRFPNILPVLYAHIQQFLNIEYFITTRNHYDALIEENNDPVHDPETLKSYMDKWDGEPFIEELRLSTDKSVLEIGVGTGRLAVRVCGKCGKFTGIDVSPKTAERAKENLRDFSNTRLICGNFLTYPFNETFDVIYSSLTFMHIQDKQTAIQRVAKLLNPGGRFVLSISKEQQTELDFGNRKIKIYPDTPKKITLLLTEAGLNISKQFETEFAVIFAAQKKIN
ncbi:MAG: histidine phosphatase family protein [Oscillospiraceae bacterium]|nr:histidine phosphatase family protein [Oscillospiraceae bacterium]